MIDQINKEHIPREERKAKPPHSKILIIDDDDGIRETIKEILTQEGYKTTAVACGKEAIDACHKESFDLGLVDIKLPDIEGTTLLQMLKKQRPAMVMIVVTGYPSLENAVEALNLGAAGYIIKPFKPERLLDQIREQLEKHKVDEWETLLVNTGLSTYEAKIYLALAMSGNAEPRKLSLSSGVPRTKAYTALKKLVQRGIVMELPGRKQRFAVSMPSDAFNGFVQNWKSDLSEQQKNLVNLERAISSLDKIHQQWQSLQSFDMQKQEVWLLKGQEQLAQRIGDLLASAQHSVSLTTNESDLVQLYRAFRKPLEGLPARGVKVHINVPIQLSNSNFVSELKTVFKVRNLPFSAHMLMLIIDNNQLLLANFGSGNGESAKNGTSLYAQSESIVSLFKNILAAPMTSS